MLCEDESREMKLKGEILPVEIEIRKKKKREVERERKKMNESERAGHRTPG